MSRSRVGRALLLAVGLGLVVWLVYTVKATQVLLVLWSSGGWLPVVLLLELLLIGIDVFAIRVLLGKAEARVSRRTWLRGTLLAYAASILLPAGKAAGEAVRAAALAREVGTTRAGGACARLQACALLANSAISLASAYAVLGAGRSERLLSLALLANALVCAGLGAILFALLQNGRLERWARSRFRRLAETHPSLDLPPDAHAASMSGVLLCVGGRLLQVGQYGVVLHAVGQLPSARTALAAEGIHLVGAAIGDFIPNQMGATDGAYIAFAGTIGLAWVPARALSIALIAHAVQLVLAAVFTLTAAFVAAHPRAVGEA